MSQPSQKRAVFGMRKPDHFSARLAVPMLILPLIIAGCSEPLDFDMRGKMGGRVDTSEAAIQATTRRPSPDARGVLSYPNYQVAIARRGDTVSTVANRIGLSAQELASYNGLLVTDALRNGELLALPRRVAEPTPTGGLTAAPGVDVTTLAGAAIERAAPTPVAQTVQSPGVEPVRHRVARGETAFTIARLYKISPKSLAEWNGLDREFNVREGQFLIIPVAQAQEEVQTSVITPVPGIGSPTPEPPSASTPLPREDAQPVKTPAPAATPKAAEKPVADIGQSQSSASSTAKMQMPVQGSIIREYAKGRNEGIDIGAPAGAQVAAAASGQVAAITRNTDNVQILVIRHPDDVLSVYTHIDDLSVAKGDAVSKGQTIGRVRAGDPAFLHFEVRKGFESTDPMEYLR